MRVGMIVALLAVLAAPAAARAGTAHVPPQHCEPYSESHFTCTATLRYDAAAGERNEVTVTGIADPPAVRFEDVGAPVRAGEGCEQAGEHAAICAVPEADVRLVRVLAGDGDDRASIGNERMLPTTLSGGAGDDVLSAAGAFGGMTLVGGPGSDRLTGSPGIDRLLDGDREGAPARDTVDGGDGLDTISYEGRSAGVSVDLAAGRGGARGEHDILTSVERAHGGRGDDRLIGTGGDDVMAGGRGDDVLRGLAGHDFLAGGGGSDNLRGGRGRDRIAGDGGADRLFGGGGEDRIAPADNSALGDHAADEVDCGAGAPDRVQEAGILDVMERSCERVALYDLLAKVWRAPPLRRDGTGVVATLHDPDCDAPPCHSVLRVTVAPGERRARPGLVLGATDRRGSRRPIRVHLSPLGRLVAQRAPRLLVRVSYASRFHGQGVEHGGFTTRLAVQR